VRSCIAFINIIANWISRSVDAILNEAWLVANASGFPNVRIVYYIIHECAFLGVWIAIWAFNLEAFVAITAIAGLTGACEAANCIYTVSINVAVVDVERTFIDIQACICRRIQLVAGRTAA